MKTSRSCRSRGPRTSATPAVAASGRGRELVPRTEPQTLERKTKLVRARARIVDKITMRVLMRTTMQIINYVFLHVIMHRILHIVKHTIMLIGWHLILQMHMHSVIQLILQSSKHIIRHMLAYIYCILV